MKTRYCYLGRIGSLIVSVILWASLEGAWHRSIAVVANGPGVMTNAPDADDGCNNGGGGSNGSGGDGAAQKNAGGSGGPVAFLACKSCGGSSGGGGNSTGGTGGGGSSCCGGMPVWEVSEPQINLWLYDEPIAYPSALGGRIAFKLSYKQRDIDKFTSEPRVISANIFSLGKNWHCSWLSYVKDGGSVSNAYVMLPDGGWRAYRPDNSTPEYYSGSILQRLTDNSGNLSGFIISKGDGAKDYYGFVSSVSVSGYGSDKVAFLTAKVDAFNQTNKLVYWETNGTVFLQYFVDADGKTNTLTYTNSLFPAQITGVTDPFGHTASLKYNNIGLLTNITDEIGMISSFKYDIQNWITNLTTPYGITTFENVTTSDNWSNTTYGSYTLVRALRVVDAAGGTNVYMLRQDSGFVKVDENDPLPFIYHDDFNYGTVMPNAPDSSSFPGASYLNYANSFHWGPKQASGLPADIWTYTPSDLLKARMCHWLRGEIPGKLSQTLEMEQAPSPDGIMRGQTIWYDYAACQQTAIGASGQPCLIAKRLPDGTTQFVAYQRDQWAHATNVVDTYSAGYGETPGTRTNVYVYDGNGINLVQQISAQGETTGYAYNSHNQVMFVTNAINEVTAYTYDQNGRRTGVTQPSGLITTNIYYNSGSAIHFLQSTIDLPINRTNSYTYSNNLVYSHTDERGLATTNTWDALQRIRRIDDVNGFITNSYDKLDLVKIVDRMGFTNAYGYDAVRRKIAQTNAVGAVTIYNYCPCGALESIQDAAGNFTSFEYDNAGNLLLATYWDGEIVNYSVTNNYDLLGRITNTIDSAGVGMTNWYNNQGLRYAAENAAGQVYFNEYDSDDHVTNSVNANKVSIKMTYDALGRLLTRNYPDGGVEGFGYTFGIAGPTSYTNQIGKVTYYGYDAARRKIAETNALNYTTLFTYNAAGDLLTLTDGKNQNTTWKYDPFGRVTNKLDNLATNLFVYKYDPDNRLTNRWSAAKASTTYKYDAVGNLTNVVYPVSPQIKLAYDKLSRLTNMVDGIGTTTYGYDAVGQLLNEGGLWPNDTVSYTYANRLRMSLSLASAPWIQRYGYDAARRLTSIISPAGEFDYAYDPAQLQRVVALTLANAAVITNQYDSVARLTLTELMNSSGSDVDSYSYSYNAANQRTNVVRTAGDYVNYTYDNIGELQTAVGKEAGGVTNRWQEQFGYAYDAAGNLNYRTNHALLQRFNINSLNELTTVTNGGRLTVAGGTSRPVTNVTVNTSNAVVYADVTFASTNQPWVNGNNTYTAIAKDIWGQRATNTVTVNLQGTNSYTYDLNGNLLSDGWRGFDYDDENQLVRVTVTNSWKSEFTYDGKMRRRILKEFTWSGSSWTQTNEVRFIYDGNLVVLERNASDQPLVEYTRGNDLSGTLQGAGGIGGLLARSQDSLPGTPFYAVHSYYHADGNGNVTMLIDASQLVMAKYLYDPYGNTLAQSGLLADANTYRFSSKEWNANSGLYYYLYRLCDPNLQRWLNRDPIGEFGGINLYGFVANCPLMRVDSNGRKWISTGKPPPPDTPTVVCKGGKPVPYVPHYSGPELNELTGGDPAQINSYFCAQKCVRKHELSHVQDILAQNPDICVGVLDGTTIGNNDPNTELLNSEQKAHQVEADCLKQCEKTCPGKAVDNQIKNNDQWIKDHQYE